MLLDLQILNGDLSPSFDKYVDTYTINVTKDTDFLIIDYQVEDGFVVNIINNELKEGDNFVYLEVKNDTEINIYTLEVYKEITKDVIYNEQDYTAVEVTPTMPGYITPLIIVICSFIIIFSFFLLFRKKKH